MINEEELIERIQQMNCEKGNLLVFYTKTDQYGVPLYDVNTLQQCFDSITSALPEGVTAIILPDKIWLSSIEDCERALEDLKKCISYLQEAMDKIGNIKNEKFSKSVKVNFKCGSLGQ